MTTEREWEQHEYTTQIGARILDASDITAYITGGKARFTVVSVLNNERFSYTVVKKERKPDAAQVYFVYARKPELEGSEYICALRQADSGVFTVVSRNLKPSRHERVFAWLVDRINERDFTACEFWHEGACCVCARPLTDEQSVLRGIGPVCEAKRASLL